MLKACSLTDNRRAGLLGRVTKLFFSGIQMAMISGLDVRANEEKTTDALIHNTVFYESDPGLRFKPWRHGGVESLKPVSGMWLIENSLK